MISPWWCSYTSTIARNNQLCNSLFCEQEEGRSGETLQSTGMDMSA